MGFNSFLGVWYSKRQLNVGIIRPSSHRPGWWGTE